MRRFIDIVTEGLSQWPERLDQRGLIEFAQQVAPRGDEPDEEMLWEMFDRADGAVLRRVDITNLKMNGGWADEAKQARYAKRKTTPPPIIVNPLSKEIVDGNHRARIALDRGETEMLAYVLFWNDEPL